MKRTFETHRPHQQRREHQQNNILHLTPCALPKIRLPNIKRVLQTIHIRLSRVRVHSREDLHQFFRDVLSGALFDQIGQAGI